MKTMNTAGGSKRLSKLLKSLREKAANDELFDLFIQAHSKVNQMTKEGLQKFLRGDKILHGCLKNVVYGIQLENTVSLNIFDFFKTKDNGGIFSYIDSDVFDYFESEVKNSPAKELSSYEFTEQITERNIIGYAKIGGIYEEVDLAHIKQICERHILKGEKLLLENGQSNIFWVRNKKYRLCKVNVCFSGSGWRVYALEFGSSIEWPAGDRSFFLN